MVCVLAPVAMTAVVIAGMLGETSPQWLPTASSATWQSPWWRRHPDLHRKRVNAPSRRSSPDRPLLVGPFAAAQFFRFVFPKLAKWIGEHGQISFYMWLMSLLVIIGRTTCFIIDLHDASVSTELWLAFAALVICLVQFKVGRAIRAPLRRSPAGGQSLGQKNTVLAVWMAQSFLNPVSSIAPDGLHRLAEFRKLLSDLPQGSGETEKSNPRG